MDSAASADPESGYGFISGERPGRSRTANTSGSAFFFYIFHPPLILCSFPFIVPVSLQKQSGGAEGGGGGLQRPQTIKKKKL